MLWLLLLLLGGEGEVQSSGLERRIDMEPTHCTMVDDDGGDCELFSRLW